MRQALALTADQVRKRQDADRRVEARRYEDVASVLATPQGRRVLLWIVDELCGLRRDVAVDVNNKTMHALGRRSVGCSLEAYLNQFSNLSTLLEQERFEQSRVQQSFTTTEDSDA